RFDWDERRLAVVTFKVSGYVEKLFVDYTGQPVRRGDPLLALYSPELLTAEREYLLARETADRLKDSRIPEAHESSAALVHASRERLRLWDVDDATVRALEKRGRPETAIALRAPISGVVIEKNVLAGQRIDPGMTLYKIGDPSILWVYADVYEQDVPLVRVGQEARIRVAQLPD